MSRAIHWMFTENNPQGELNVYLQGLHDKGILEYAIWQLEVGENAETAPEHHQGFLVFTKKLRFNQVKQLMPFSHLEVAKKPTNAARYCMKPDRLDGPWEIGIWIPREERGNVWKNIVEEMKTKRPSQLAATYPAMWAMHKRGFYDLWNTLQPKRNFKTQVVVIIGPTGVGKSKMITDAYDANDVYWKPSDKWFDGYENETNVVLDDFYGNLPFKFILNLLDRYPFKIEYKGGHYEFNSRRIIITSNKWPHDWYSNEVKEKHEFEALLRRIDKVIYYDSISRSFITVETPLEFLKARCI